VLSAANERIADLVAQKRFRKDLWQRLCETEVSLPPLRARPEEIEALVRHFCSHMPGGPYRISDTALEVLCSVPWRSGNVRELRNCLRAMTELHVDKLLTPLSIPARIWKQVEDPEGAEAGATSPAPAAGATPTLTPVVPGATASFASEQLNLSWDPTRPFSFDVLADQLLLEVLRRLSASRPRLSLREAARIIGMSRSTLSGRLKGLVQKNLVPAEELLPLVGNAPKTKMPAPEGAPAQN
jgi:DNA-binding NtrC family response regulator